MMESERDRVREGTVIRVVPRSRFVPEAAAGGFRDFYFAHADMFGAHVVLRKEGFVCVGSGSATSR